MSDTRRYGLTRWMIDHPPTSNSPHLLHGARLLLLAVASATIATPAWAQLPDSAAGPAPAIARAASQADSCERGLCSGPWPVVIAAIAGAGSGGEAEAFLRYAQLTAGSPYYPWSIRGFSAAEVRRMSVASPLPWPLAPARRAVAVTPPSLETSYNTGFPYGSNDGPVWQGRGATVALSFGVAAAAGPLNLVLQPIVFAAENRGFVLAPTGFGGRLVYADPQFAEAVDRPQRFGDGVYSRFDPGESTVRIDAGPAALGVSSATQTWGPMSEFPFLLGNNAPGILHAFVGSARPLNVGIGRVHARVMWGRLEQSDYSPVTGSERFFNAIETGTIRFTTGAIASFSPRWPSGLEIGFARLYHSVWPQEGLPPTYFRKAFDPFLKQSLAVDSALLDPQGGTDNQLASAFLRWAFPASGFEFYFEYGREDHSWDIHDFLNEPDHSRSYGLGFRKVLRADSARLMGLRAELINFQMPHIGRHRVEGATYIHSIIRQGHTHHGQLLGADVGVGAAAGSVVAWDRYTPGARLSIFARRNLRRERGGLYQPPFEAGPAPFSDVAYAVGFERVRFKGRTAVSTGLTLVQNLNRDYGGDRFNAHARLGVSFGF